jgi:hypothetical protein
MKHFEIDIEKEGFVKTIQRGKLNSSMNKSFKDYLFYLTCNNRATIINNPNNIVFYEKGIYQYYFDILNNFKSEKKTTINNIELIMSFTSTFNKILALELGSKEWETYYISETEKILDSNLKDYLNKVSFYHQYDSSLFRLHNHTLISPYIKKEKEFNQNKKVEIIASVPYLDKNILEKIKIEYNELAKKSLGGISFSKINNYYDIINKKIIREFGDKGNLSKNDYNKIIENISFPNVIYSFSDNNLDNKKMTNKEYFFDIFKDNLDNSYNSLDMIFFKKELKKHNLENNINEPTFLKKKYKEKEFLFYGDYEKKIAKKNIKKMNNIIDSRDCFLKYKFLKEEDLFVFFAEKKWIKNKNVLKMLINILIENVNDSNIDVLKKLIDFDELWDIVLSSQQQWLIIKMILISKKYNIDIYNKLCMIDEKLTVAKDYKYIYEEMFGKNYLDDISKIKNEIVKNNEIINKKGPIENKFEKIIKQIS